MQVADIQGVATAATLGAQQTQSVGMVEDAAFLMMLSSNLYSNQQLACIREVICNAWDAHIEAGTTHVPISITITKDNELIIRDSGNGIPHDKIVEIYGTYGKSTKRNNSAVTGGFGLGSKSPWAYTDSFRVTSENQGKKVVYNMVRSSVEAGGMPAIQTVLTLPTERTGVTVQFTLNEADVRQMTHYIKSIVMNGGILADLTMPDVDGEEITNSLPTLQMDTTPGSYDVSTDWYQHYMGNHDVFVRYGAVIYPMLETPATQKALNLLKQFMEIVGFRRMVVQAAPGTLALTPSREALSSQKMTEDGLTDLCVALVARIEEDIIKQIPASILKAVEHLAKGDSFSHALAFRAPVQEAITPYAVRKYLYSTLGSAKRLKYDAMLLAAEHRGFKNTHTFVNKTATKEYHKLRIRLRAMGTQADRDRHCEAFLHRFILRPMSRVFQKHADILREDQLYHSEYFQWNDGKRKSRLLEKLDVAHLVQMQQFIDAPIMFVTSRIKKLKQSIQCCPDLENWNDAWVYRLSNPKDSHKDDIIKAFTEAGMKVIDLTLNHEWDDVAYEIEQEREARNARRAAQGKQVSLPVGAKRIANALLSLSNVYGDDGQRKMGIGSIKLMNKTDKQTTDTPLFYVPVDELTSTGSLGHFWNYIDLSQEEKERGVIVRNGIEKNMAVKRGAIHMNNYLVHKFWDAVHAPAFTEYRTKHRLPALEEQFPIQVGHLELLQYLGIKLPGYDKLRVDDAMERLGNRLSNTLASTVSACSGKSADGFQSFYQIKEQKLEEPAFVAMVKKVRHDPMLARMLFTMSSPLELIQQFPDRKAAIKSLVMSAMKGKTNE
ncbi:ATP-binding protein [Caballeronia sp. LZ034LL]|uniref:ATP-binding protein n=1 Tax=Caballeronia sp. LZ034LL TaxID=3038567 RepID=UPI0028557FD5|nr:ATP-binding protein [Caballeronia sp. LZ034LL]MDR5839297.1 ATP-binding protein [Caballeronia sp. LZ034LL]